MPFRFRKIFKIFPGVKINLSKSGLSTSIGKAGATINFSKKGIRKTVGIPGTGMSWSDLSTGKTKTADPADTQPIKRAASASYISSMEPSAPKPKIKLPFWVVPTGGILTFACLAAFCISSLITPASPPLPTQDQAALRELAIQTAWANITQTAQAIPTLQVTSTQITVPTETATLIPVMTSTLASSSSPAACIPPSDPQVGRVLEVLGSNIVRVIMDADGLIYSVRYIGIETPENKSINEPKSAAKNFELVVGQTVNLYKDASDRDASGYLLRYVLIGDTFVNYELISQGYAIAALQPPDTSCQSVFEKAQQSATAVKAGLWGVPTPLPTIQVVFPTQPIIPSGGSNSGGGSGGVCCKVCGANSKACGDSCISNDKTCHQPPGCACDG